MAVFAQWMRRGALPHRWPARGVGWPASAHSNPKLGERRRWY